MSLESEIGQLIHQHTEALLADVQRLTEQRDTYKIHLSANVRGNQAKAVRIKELEQQLATRPERAPVVPCSEEELRVMQTQLQEQSRRLAALQRDADNYHHLVGSIGASSMAQAIHWVQWHRVSEAYNSSRNGSAMQQPACGSVVIGSAYDKDCNPRD